MSGIQLTVLSLNHVDLGDTRMQLLCQGLARYSGAVTCDSSIIIMVEPVCAEPKQMGAAALAVAITPTQGPPGKPLLHPKLTLLDLQGNALGGEGLTQLCPGIAACATLVELNLRAVGITDQHQDAVRRFADIVSCHEALQVVNLDGNLVGAALLLTTIRAKPEVWSLSVTRFVSRPIMLQLIEQLAANAKLHKVKGSTGRRTKKKSLK
ncbi:hypothetical protein ABBQ32_004469 [Trebouxia sp. C0010 RCD-2024]